MGRIFVRELTTWSYVRLVGEWVGPIDIGSGARRDRDWEPWRSADTLRDPRGWGPCTEAVPPNACGRRPFKMRTFDQHVSASRNRPPR